MRILVTGGNGALGRRLVPHLQRRRVTVRTADRGPDQRGEPGVERAVADLATGLGVPEALAGVDVVVHLASDPFDGARDVEMSRRLLDAARASEARHVAYMSIVGLERMQGYDYYRAKLEVERLLVACGLPHTVLRSTQFHELVASLIASVSADPVVRLPADVALQPVELEAVAERLAEASVGAPAGHLPEVGGPEVRSLESLARAYYAARSWQREVRLEPSWERPPFSAWRGGAATESGAVRLGATWEEWLGRTGDQTNPYERRQRGRGAPASREP